MRVFVTGATGFIGGRLAHKLRERGDDVVALVRSPEKASGLAAAGVELIQGDLSSNEAIRQAADHADAAVHAAAIYKVGIPKSEHADMYDANVRGTERVLDAAFEAGVPKIVYVSTINAFGNTRGAVVDESFHREPGDYVSYYDETKFLSHQAALDRIAKGVPITIVQPGGVYGPGDHSEVGNIIDQVRTGKLAALPFPKLGLNLVFVDDVADGIILALDKGEVGEAYVLGGEITTMRGLVDKVGELEGRDPPKRDMPTPLMKLAVPVGPLVGKLMGFPPNLRELISASDGVTYWAKDDKAREKLGYSPRDLATGLRETLEATAA